MSKFNVELAGCYAVIRYYTVYVTVYPDTEDEDVITCTVETSSGEQNVDEYLMEVTVVDDLPEGITKEEIVNLVKEKWDHL